MPAAERNVVDCLYPLITKKTALSFVQRPNPYAAIQPGFRHVGGDRCIRFPVLLQKNYRVTTSQFRRTFPRSPESSPHFQRARLTLSDGQLITKIHDELKHLEQSFGDSEFPLFASNLRKTLQSWDGKSALPVLMTLRQAFDDRGEAGLDLQIKYLFHGHVAHRNFSKSDLEDQEKLADLRFPTDWYAATRAMQRSIHLHVGPTNSGKTYHALKRLENAKSGIYAGPLRLLAHEVYTRLNAKGISCNLLTGDERLSKEGEPCNMVSCTVEMVPLDFEVDVAIIDEIQLIGSKERGWAWTQALLGCMAKEVHLCGETRTVPLIRELAKLMGDTVEIHNYERLSPLQTMPESLKGDLNNLKKGDCLVVFSKRGIHEMKTAIEKRTKKRVAIVYGDLPPETRVQQARLFNEPDNDYDFLVASDAIGMGLNLSIKRIIFESTIKRTVGGYRQLEDHQIKQIGGRAGRFRAGAQVKDDGSSPGKPHDAAPTEVGLVTSFDTLDFANVMRGMQSEPTPVLTAGIFPTSQIVSQFAAFFPLGTPFSYILRRINELALMQPRFHTCDLRDQIRVADIIEQVKDLTISDRLIFCAAPVNLATEEARKTCRAFAKCVANNGGGGLLEITELDLDLLDKEVTRDPYYRTQLEALHKSLILYMWLGYRFEGVFPNREMASYVKQLVQERIEKVLVLTSRTRSVEQRRLTSKALHQLAEKREMELKIHAGNMINGDPSNNNDGNPITRGTYAAPPEARDALAQSTQQPTDSIINLEYLRNPLSETRAAAATT